MSNIDQNTIITLLEEVIPQMQSSENAENTLMKFAADKNLAPAVVERMCHAFNQLKTNCILDHAESMEKRGSSFSLIDGADFVKRYSDFAKDIDVSKMEDSISKSKNLWGIPSNEEAISFKLASSNIINAGDTFSYISDYERAEHEKLDALISDTHTKIASKADSHSTFDYRDVVDAKRDVETVNEVITELAFEQDAIVNKIAKELSINTNKIASFESAERDALYLSDDVSSDAVDSLINGINYKNKYVASNIKRASDKGGRRLVKQASELTKDIISYCETSNKIAAALEIKKSFEKIARKLTDEELNSLIATGGEAPPFNPDDYPDDDELENNKNKTEPAFNPSDNLADDLSDLDSSVFEAFSEKAEKENNATFNSSKKDVNKGDSSQDRFEAKSIIGGKELGKGLAKAIEDVSAGSAKAYDNIIDLNKTLAKIDNDTNSKPHPKTTIVKNNILNTIADLNFQKMMMTDPILSRLTPEEVDNVTESYMTYKIQYPEIALQPSLLKSILRSSAQVEGGEDVNTLKSLVDARKSLVDARSKESILG